MRVEAEHSPTPQSGRPLLDDPDAEVAVLDRPREVAFLEGRAHRGVLTRGYATAEDQRLGPPADAAPKCPDQDVVGPWLRQRRRTDLARAGFAQPVRERVMHHRRASGPRNEP